MNGQCSATRGEKRHPAPRIATAINMVMELFCWGWNNRQDHICGTQQVSWLQRLAQGFGGNAYKSWRWRRGHAWLQGRDFECRAGGAQQLLATGEHILNQLLGQLAQGSWELSWELPCMSAWELAVSCSCHSHEGTCIMSKVKKRCFVVTGSLKNFHQFQPPHSAESIPLLQEVLGEGASLSKTPQVSPADQVTGL